LPDIIKVSSFGFHGNHTPQLTKKTTVNFQTKDKGNIRITGCDILPDGKLVFTEKEDKRLLMFSNNGNYEKDIVRFSGIP
jgi:hypothetical protein